MNSAPFFLESKRLILREFHLDDAGTFYLLNNNKEVMRYTGDRPFKNIEDAQELIKTYPNYKRDGYGRWTVIEKSSNKIIGWCGLKNQPGEYVDLGYRFLQEFWGQGYATEAAQACIAYGFDALNLHEIVGRTAIENLASIRVLEKIGMHFWKKDECEGIKDSVYYQILKS